MYSLINYELRASSEFFYWYLNKQWYQMPVRNFRNTSKQNSLLLAITYVSKWWRWFKTTFQNQKREQWRCSSPMLLQAEWNRAGEALLCVTHYVNDRPWLNHPMNGGSPSIGVDKFFPEPAASTKTSRVCSGLHEANIYGAEKSIKNNCKHIFIDESEIEVLLNFGHKKPKFSVALIATVRSVLNTTKIY